VKPKNLPRNVNGNIVPMATQDSVRIVSHFTYSTRTRAIVSLETRLKHQIMNVLQKSNAASRQNQAGIRPPTI
jgi:hypothetical protein